MVFCFSTSWADGLALIKNPKEALELRLALIAGESKEIKLSSFIFKNDEVGKLVLEELILAAERGVVVKLLIDGHGSKEVLSKKHAFLLKKLSDLGGGIKVFHPTGIGNVMMNPLHLPRRLHDKILVGSSEMIIGDRNQAVEYFGLSSSEEKNMVSTEVFVGDDLTVKKSKKYFDYVWQSNHVEEAALPFSPKEGPPSMGRKDIDRSDQLALLNSKRQDLKPGEVRFVHDRLDKFLLGKDSKMGADKNNFSEMIRLINKANHTVEIVNSYVILEPSVKNALENAAQRGVDVEILTNSTRTSDVPLIAKAFSTQVGSLRRAGIRVMEFSGNDSLHSKVIVVDSKEAYVGSFNLDPRSARLNTETGIVFTSDKVVFDLQVHLEKTRKASIPWRTQSQKLGAKCRALLFKAIALPIIRNQL